MKKAVPKICPQCKGKGGYQSTDTYYCEKCPKEGCCGPHDNPNCRILATKCRVCGGRGIINSPDSPVIYVHPLATYGHTHK